MKLQSYGSTLAVIDRIFLQCSNFRQEVKCLIHVNLYLLQNAGATKLEVLLMNTSVFTSTTDTLALSRLELSFTERNHLAKQDHTLVKVVCISKHYFSNVFLRLGLGTCRVSFQSPAILYMHCSCPKSQNVLRVTRSQQLTSRSALSCKVARFF